MLYKNSPFFVSFFHTSGYQTFPLKIFVGGMRTWDPNLDREVDGMIGNRL